MVGDSKTGREANLETNRVIEANLREMADLLEQQEADGFRVTAYRHAADTVANMDRSLANVFADEGLPGLTAIPTIGRSIAAAIAEMLGSGRWSQLDRLRGTTEPEELFCTIPGIGSRLATRLHDDLHLDTLEALETAAHDGRLATVSGFGAGRIAIIKATLQERLGRRRIRRQGSTGAPSVELLLDVDREYRQRAGRDDLRKIAPRRFNPQGRAWLPVLHTRREDWILTAMFSNTRRAHELKRTHSWVVIYYHTDHFEEGQCTVVDETVGPWRGFRVVRGREAECANFQQSKDAVA